MRWPRWLDRERRLHQEKTIGKIKAQAATMWFRQYQRCLAERSRLVAENAELRALLAQYEGNPSQ